LGYAPRVKRRLTDFASRLTSLLATGRESRASWRDDAAAPPAALSDYFQPPAGLVERAIALQPRELTGAPRSSYQALANYQIRDFGEGVSAVEAIVRHVLTSKLRAPSEGAQNELWHDTVCVPVRCELTQAATGRGFDELQPSQVADINSELATREPHRIGDIERYARMIEAGEALEPALFVSGAVLNALIGTRRASPRAMYMLDGARRICATALAHRSSVEILLIVREDQLVDLLPAQQIEALRTRLSSLTWFHNYQSLPLVGLNGERTLRRFSLMDLDLLRDQVVLDFGCNVGGACLKAVQAGARRVVGLEGMADTCALAKDIGTLVGFEALEYLHVDFNDSDFEARIDSLVPERADYAFFFSVYRTKELTQRERLFRYIINKVDKGIFFEGHADAIIDTLTYYEWLFDCFDLKYRFLGHSEGDLRPLFFIDRRANA
jgi:SAM-dependent methyltransferase